MVDSGPQWEAVLRRQKEKNPNDPNHRRSRHRSRSLVFLIANTAEVSTSSCLCGLSHITVISVTSPAQTIRDTKTWQSY